MTTELTGSLTLEKPIHEYLRDHAQRNPDHTAITFYGRNYSYGWLDEATDRLATFLLDRGIRKGDCVALYMQNSPQYVIAHFAAQKIGATVAPCNPMFKEWELEFELGDTKAKAIFVLDELFERFAAIADRTSVETVVLSSYEDFLPEGVMPEGIAGEFVRSAGDHAAVLASAIPLMSILTDESIAIDPERLEVDFDMHEDVSLLMYTSGTTGKPKGAMLTYENVEFKTACLVRTYELTADDVVLAVMPIFHIAGMLVGMNAPIMAGATMAIIARFEPDTMLQVIENAGVTFTYTTPIMNIQMLEHNEDGRYSLDSLRGSIGTSFGLQVTEELSNRWQQVAGVPFIEFAYGMSETHTADTMQRLDEYRWGSVGKPTYETEIEIRSLEDRSQPVPVGEIGEIVVRSRSVFKGYLGREEATAASKQDGWYFSGDIGRFDEDGFMYFQGRNKEMIKCNGYSVFPEEVEEFLARHSDVSAVAVIGVPDPVRGESVMAFVVPTANATVTEEELVAWSREHMAAYKYPREVRFVDSLPQTSTGKLLRRILRDQITEERNGDD